MTDSYRIWVYKEQQFQFGINQLLLFFYKLYYSWKRIDIKYPHAGLEDALRGFKTELCTLLKCLLWLLNITVLDLLVEGKTMIVIKIS